jgi:gluconolactonase
LAFSADESELYIVETRLRTIRRFDVAGDGSLSGGAEFVPGWFDGIRLDTHGRIWAASVDGLHCYDPDGSLLGKLLTPEGLSNLTFGGPRRNNLFLTTNAGDVYSIRVTFTGVKTV